MKKDKKIQKKIEKQLPTKGNKGQHLDKKERFVIEKMLNANRTQKEVAEILQRGESTISEEIKRGSVDGEYIAEKAHHKAYVRQYWKKQDCLKVSMDIVLKTFVEDAMKKRLSPEEISEATRNNKTNIPYISAKAIRKYVSKRRPDLEQYLFWNRNKMKTGRKRGKGKYLQDKTRSFIEQRELDFPLYELEYGHWEGDFIVSRHNSTVLLVLVEKSTKNTLITKLPNRKNTLVNESIFSLLLGYTVKSLTLDNDIAFHKWKDLEKQLACNIYFAHPYHSWEKGLVENTNRWIREFVPKKTDLSKVDDEYIKSIQYWLNNKPRVILNGDTAYECMIFEEKGYMVSSVLLDFPKEKNSYLGVG